MIPTIPKSALLVAGAIIVATPSSARADCRVSGAGTIYLGDGGSYTLMMVARRNEACAISFTRQASGVEFSSLDVASPPKYGRFSGGDTFHLFYTPPPNGDGDSFVLKVCGRDAHGTGCNVLNYRVAIIP